MGRGKRKRKANLKRKRDLKRKRGILTPFSLANSSKNYRGRKNKHEIKTNIHNLNYVRTVFENIKYTNSNVTHCKFRDTKFIGIDYIGTNLKGSNFRNALFENVIFYNVNLKGTNFRDAKFKNSFFVNTNLKHAKNLDIKQKGIKVINKNLENFNISQELQDAIHLLVSANKFKKNFVLTTKSSKGTKINKTIIFILLLDFTERELVRSFKKIFENRRKSESRFYMTYHSYYTFLMKYLKKGASMELSGPGFSKERKVNE